MPMTGSSVTRLCFTSLCFVLSLLSSTVFAESLWDVREGEAILGTSGWVVSAERLDVQSKQLIAFEFVVLGFGDVVIRGAQLTCTTTSCAMVDPVVFRKGAAVRAKQGELELSTGRVVLKELGNWILEER